MLSRRPEWAAELAPFEAEAAWIIGDWDTVEHVGARAPAVGRALLALYDERDIEPMMLSARREIGGAITSRQYSRAYDPILQLHLLREIELVHSADLGIAQLSPDRPNYRVLVQQKARDLVKGLDERFQRSSPSFRVREAILTIRRTALTISRSPLLKSQVGLAWIQSAKIARKAGYEQTAYSATLQAREAEAPFAFVQQAKLLKGSGGAWKALTDLENMVDPLLKREMGKEAGKPVDLTVTKTEEDFQRDRNLAKVCLAL